MYKRIHLKKRRNFKISKINGIIIIFILIIIAVFLSFKFISEKVTPSIMNYAELQAGKLATYIIRQAVSNEVTDKINVDDLFIMTKDSNNEIKSIDFNPLTVNKMLSLVTENVNLYLTKFEKGELDELDIPSSNFNLPSKKKLQNGIIFEIPSGMVFGNSILSNIGPKIPVKLNLVGDIDSDVETDVTNYGINNALIEVIIKVHVVEQVILPFTSKKIEVEMNVPVAIKLIQGNVPNYYFNGTGSNTKLSIPITS